MEQTGKAVYLTTASLPVTNTNLSVAETATTSKTIQLSKESEDCVLQSETEQGAKPGSSASTNESSDNLNEVKEEDSLDNGNDEGEDESEYEMDNFCDSDDPMEFGNFELNDTTTSANGNSNQSDQSGANTEQAKMELFWRLMDMGFSRGT